MDNASGIIGPNDCKLRTGKSIQPTQFCTESESIGIAQNVHYLSRNWVVLHGIASYSSNGLYVYENVLKHMDWITSTVNEN